MLFAPLQKEILPMVALPQPMSHTVLAIWQAYETEATQNGYDSLGVPMSQAAHPCDRAIWYALRWAVPPEGVKGERQRRFATGDLEEIRLLDDLERAGIQVERVDPASGQQFRVQLAKGWLRGKMDARGFLIPEAPKTWHVIECKSHNEKSFKQLVKLKIEEGKPDHYMQCQAYMHATKLTRCLYLAVNKNTDEIYAERVRYDKKTGHNVEVRVQRIVNTYTAPPRLYEDPNSKGAMQVCRWCRALDQCHHAAWARINCRTCISAEFLDDAVVRCKLWDKELDYKAQQEGCSSHLYLPSLVPGEQIDASENERWIKYQLANGLYWTDGINKN